MYLLDLAIASLLTIVGFFGLWVRSPLLGGFVFLIGGFGVALFLDLLLVGVPVGRQDDPGVGLGFFVAWLLLFVLLRLLLRRTTAGQVLFERVQAFLERFEGTFPASDWDGDPDYVERRQFDYSIQVAATRLKEKQRRARELTEIYRDPDSPQAKRP